MWRAALVAVVALGATAHADTRAWTAAEKVLPGGLAYVGAGRNTRVRDAMKLVHAELLGEILSTCHVDPQRAVDSFAFGVRGDGRGLVVVALAGADRARIDACATAAGKHA